MQSPMGIPIICLLHLPPFTVKDVSRRNLILSMMSLTDSPSVHCHPEAVTKSYWFSIGDCLDCHAKAFSRADLVLCRMLSWEKELYIVLKSYVFMPC